MFENILNEIKKHDRIIIHRHTFPDGDAIGSQVGMKKIIEANFPEKEVYIVGDDPKRYAFIEDSAPDIIADEMYEGSLAIILDTPTKERVADNRFKKAETTIKIDHHIFCEKFADIELIDTSYESCAGLISDFARENALIMSPSAAKAIYTGMVTDSGRFRYDSTTAQTFIRAAYLTDSGFDISEVYNELYAEDFDYIKLKAQFILKIKFTEKNVAYIFTPKEELALYKADSFTISRGMVATMSDLKGVDIWVNFTETDSGILCELRSSKYDINKIAVKYGGGGHLKASGANLKDRETIFNMLTDLDALIG